MNCPACNHKLSTGFEIGDHEFVAWCGHGKCPSIKANNGAAGKTEQEAIDNLIRILETEPDYDA